MFKFILYMDLIECIPNFSEGRNIEIIRQIIAEIQGVTGVKLLGAEMGASANRTVVTFAGTPEAVSEAAFRAIQKSTQLIDMQKHIGTHPRIGVTDVCPLVPISGISLEETAELARKLAQRVGDKFRFPVYCYESSSVRSHLRKLEDVRKGEYESLTQRIQDPDFQPDFGFWDNYERVGASIIGARNFLIAYNFNLNTDSVEIAQKIAQEVRESGKIIRKNGKILRDKNNRPLRIQGKCKGVKAIGWKLDGYDFAQVSTNITDISQSPVHEVFEEIKKSAKNYDVQVTGAELIGLTPLKVMLEAADFYLVKYPDIKASKSVFSELEKINLAIKYLGLDDLCSFHPEEKIIEYRLKEIKPLEIIRQM